MENENDILNLADFYAGHLVGNGGVSTITIPDPDFNGNPYSKPIVIPERFKEVVLKMCPEVKDIVSNGYRDNKVYDPQTFNPIYKYLVGVDLYFDEKYGMKKTKKEYGDELTDYFKMTYDGMDFVSFHVQSFIFPPEKTNEDKFFEVFGVSEK
jgi:hypothetical protein